MQVGSGLFWVVAQTKAQREQWAAENISRQGFTYYLPLTAAPKKPTTRSKSLPKPQCLFPRYIFVQTDGRWRCLLGTFGVNSLVMCGDKPAVLPNSQIEALQTRQNSEGLIVLPTRAEERFKKDDMVRINAGPFSGYTGIYDHCTSDERVRVLLNVLGRKTAVLIGESYVEAA